MTVKDVGDYWGKDPCYLLGGKNKNETSKAKYTMILFSIDLSVET